MIFPGEENLWNILLASNIEKITSYGGVEYLKEGTGGYKIRILNTTYKILFNRVIIPEMHPHLRFLTLLYLTHAKDIYPSYKWIGLSGIRWGDFFFRGSHKLPLNELASKYSKDIENFYRHAFSLGGIKVNYGGDASVCLWPFPKLPVIYILWKEDDEFPAHTTLLFDETAEKHIVLEGLWGIAFFTTYQLLQQ